MLIDAHWLTDENVEHHHCEAFPLVVLIAIVPAQLRCVRCWKDGQQSVAEVRDQVDRRYPKDIII